MGAGRADMQIYGARDAIYDACATSSARARTYGTAGAGVHEICGSKVKLSGGAWTLGLRARVYSMARLLYISPALSLSLYLLRVG